MTPRAWVATWAEIGSLVADHISEGLTMLARAIDPPVTDEGTGEAWIVKDEAWCEEHMRTEVVRRLYTSIGGELPTFRGQNGDHDQDEESQ